MKDQLTDFIEKNGLQFTPGRRNSDCVVLCGYALYLNKQALYKYKPKGIIEEILADKLSKDSELRRELNNVYSYARANNYENWWEDEANKLNYKTNA